MDTRDIYKLVRELSEENDNEINLYDSVDVELSEDFVIETGIVGFKEDGIIIHLDEDAVEMLDLNGILLESEDVLSEDSVDSFKNKLSRVSDPFGMIYDAIKGDYGEEIRVAMQEMYDDVVNDSGYRLHPDDDFEKIIEVIVDQLVDDGEMYESQEDDDSHLIDSFKEKVASSSNPFELVYDAISGNHGEQIRVAVQDAYDDISIDFGLHPDDDFESIINKIIDYCDHDSGDMSIDDRDQIDEIAMLKRLMGKEEPPRVARVTHKTPAELWKQHTEPKKSTDKVPVDPITGKTLYQKVKDLAEAEYQGRKVTLNKPMQGDVKKSKVYVKKPDGKVVKVNFGDKDMKIKKSNPERRKSFRARHNCDNPGPKWKARYWSCKAW
jgi:hypothetical protein